MPRNQFVTTTSIICLVVGVLLWGAHMQGTKALVTQLEPRAKPSAQRSEEIPEHIFYGEVFSLLAELKNIADYQREAALSDYEASFLEEIATDCAGDVARQDAKAEAFINAFRRRMRRSLGGKRPQPVPAELTELQKERDAIALRHRDRLRKALGEDAFKRFTEAAKSIVHVTLEPIQ
jgi:hypothetical protein